LKRKARNRTAVPNQNLGTRCMISLFFAPPFSHLDPKRPHAAKRNDPQTPVEASLALTSLIAPVGWGVVRSDAKGVFGHRGVRREAFEMAFGLETGLGSARARSWSMETDGTVRI
jgi:hypothetical protein